MASSRTQLHTVELLESEKVVANGVARQTWSVHQEGCFRPAHRLPGAEVTMRSSGSGFIWARTVALKLATGTRLELTQESPRPREHSSTFKILTLDQKSSTLRRKTLHEISSDGRVVRLAR